MTVLPPDGPYDVTVDRASPYEAASALDAALAFAARVGAVECEFVPPNILVTVVMGPGGSWRFECPMRWWTA